MLPRPLEDDNTICAINWWEFLNNFLSRRDKRFVSFEKLLAQCNEHSIMNTLTRNTFRLSPNLSISLIARGGGSKGICDGTGMKY